MVKLEERAGGGLYHVSFAKGSLGRFVTLESRFSVQRALCRDARAPRITFQNEFPYTIKANTNVRPVEIQFAEYSINYHRAND
ncbi:hypothetical protein WN51_01283 [Melipona quadrifasciata]|uniref:Uncharacterized protein n=1 Tax=Melipona quadrifasciata TaxID=166423 RepID=A0A0N0BF18_9HYME|nr:hypothetical protein WN51_01283 [Melipona quadrifasciata]